MHFDGFDAVRDAARLQHMAAILIRYGFGDMVRRLGLGSLLERAGRILHWQAAAELAGLEPPARVRRALEDLGPTFVKLGQILGTRVDLFPPAWIAEFSRLQDATPAVPWELLRPQLIEDLGADPLELFAEFDTTPLAAASLAQVHRARLDDGTPVILKIRRPGIRPVIEADLRLLARLADMAQARLPELRRYRISDVVKQFRQSLLRELDFAAECRNAERIAASFADWPTVVVPTVHWAWCGERMNVQALVQGIPGRDLAALDAAGLDRRQLARNGADAMLKMMLADGFFHADPHPGNVFYLEGNRVAFIDFGMVGRLSERRRIEVARLVKGLVDRDADSVCNQLLDWSDGSDHDDDGNDEGVDADSLREAVDGFIELYRDLPLKKIDMAAVLSDLMRILRDQALALPPDLAMLVKALITLEGLGRQLDPDFEIADATQPLIEEILIDQHRPAALARRGRHGLQRLTRLLGGLPTGLEQVLRVLKRGRIQHSVEVRSLREFGDQIDRAANRLTMGIVIAALIIGSSIVLGRGNDQIFPGGPTLGTLGFIGAVVGGIWLLISIARSGRHRK